MHEMAAKNASRFLKTLLFTFLTRPTVHVIKYMTAYSAFMSIRELYCFLHRCNVILSFVLLDNSTLQAFHVSI